MKKIPLYAADVRALEALDPRPPVVATILERYNAPAPVKEGLGVPAVQEVERAFLAGAQHRGVALGMLAPHDYIEMSRAFKQLGVTVELAGLVGRWVQDQTWMKQPADLRTMLRHWPKWLMKARNPRPVRRAGPAPME